MLHDAHYLSSERSDEHRILMAGSSGVEKAVADSAGLWVGGGGRPNCVVCVFFSGLGFFRITDGSFVDPWYEIWE